MAGELKRVPKGDDMAVSWGNADSSEVKCVFKGRMTLSSPRWSRPRCPELVAGSRKQVEVVVMGLTMYRICLQWVTWSWGRSPYHNSH